MYRFVFTVLLGLIATGLSGRNTVGAQDDLVDLVRQFPPSSIDSSSAKSALSSIEWQLQLRTALMSRYDENQEKMSIRTEANSALLKRLNSELPPEVRFVDKSIRSQLIGKTMEELLDAKLDLAARESTVVLLEQMLAEGKVSKQAELRKHQAQMAIDAAKLKLGVAQAEYEKVKKLSGKGSKTLNEARTAEYVFEIARIELESAVLQSEVELAQENSELAQRLTEARIEIAPVKARIKAAEKFLSTFVESAQTSTQIEEIQRKVEFGQMELRDLASQAFLLRQEVEELSVLKSRIEDELKSMADSKKKDQQGK